MNLKELSILNESIGKGYRVVTLISAGILEGLDSMITAKNHWIVWGDAVCKINGGYITPKDSDELIELKLFSWGRVEY